MKRVPVLTLNVLALAVLSAMLAVLCALWMTKPASAAYTNDYDSVDCSGGRCEIRYQTSTRYGYAVSHSVSVWNNLGSVSILPDNLSSVQDVAIYDAIDKCDVTWVGMYTEYYGGIVDNIRYNVCNFQESGYDPYAIKGTATHEMGHALGLDHSYKPNVMYYISRQSGVNIPQGQDVLSYRSLWG